MVAVCLVPAACDLHSTRLKEFPRRGKLRTERESSDFPRDYEKRRTNFSTRSYRIPTPRDRKTNGEISQILFAWKDYTCRELSANCSSSGHPEARVRRPATYSERDGSESSHGPALFAFDSQTNSPLTRRRLRAALRLLPSRLLSVVYVPESQRPGLLSRRQLAISVSVRSTLPSFSRLVRLVRAAVSLSISVSLFVCLSLRSTSA